MVIKMNRMEILPNTPLSELNDMLGMYSILNIDALGGVTCIAVKCGRKEVFITLHPKSHIAVNAGLITVFCSRIDIQVKRLGDEIFLLFGCWENNSLVGDFNTELFEGVAE